MKQTPKQIHVVCWEFGGGGLFAYSFSQLRRADFSPPQHSNYTEKVTVTTSRQNEEHNQEVQGNYL